MQKEVEEYDWDIYDLFKEQITSQLPHIQYHILILEQKDTLAVTDSLNELFRYFHTYKATSSYLSLIPLYKLVCKTETVLCSLRENKQIIQESIIEWLLQVTNQLTIYLNELEEKETILSPLPIDLLNKIQITSPYIKPKDKLKTLSLLYMDKNLQRAKKIVPFLKKYTSSVKYSSEKDKHNTIFNMKPYDIIITNLDKENHQIIEFCKQNHPNLPIIAIFNQISPVSAKQLLNKGITHSIENPLNAKTIERELLSVVKLYFTSTNIIINHKKINNFIETLQPLPNTIFQITQICDDEEIPVKELIKVVKTDPIIAGNILKIANSPIYGSVRLKTIDQAVIKFGKKAIKALTMCGVYNSLGSINLSSYNITEDTFSNISMLRLSLMLKWYSKISIGDLSVLSSTALLGNIGQLLISKELVDIGQDDKFKELCMTFEIKYAEESILHTTTNLISSQILRYWKLSPDIVEIIEHSDNPKDAPKELRKLCAANYIVNSLVSINGKVAKEIPDNLQPLMTEFDFNPSTLLKALNSIK